MVDKARVSQVGASKLENYQKKYRKGDDNSDMISDNSAINGLSETGNSLMNFKQNSSSLKNLKSINPTPPQ